MQLTQEQKSIIACDSAMIAINAFAGTGKTSTLVEYAKARPNWKFLYVAYNKAMQIDAVTKFPKNVGCRTLHSLAYARVGKNYGANKIGNNRIWDLCTELGLAPDDQLHAKMANGVIATWHNSNQFTLDMNSVAAYSSNLPIYEQKELAAISSEILELANGLWELMLDKNYTRVKMPHDGYLKLFQLSKPRFNVDCLMLDEAQDSNDITLAIINAARCEHKIVVGDVHQAIYQFRGSKNALADFRRVADNVFYLTDVTQPAPDFQIQRAET